MISTLTIQSLPIGVGTDYTILSARGFESPSLEVSRSPLAGQHGGVVHRSLWRERRIRLEIGLRSNTQVGYASLRKSLIEAFDLPRNGNTTMSLTTTDGKTLQMDVNLSDLIDGGFRPGELTVGKMRFELISGDPSIVDQTLNETTLTPPVAGGVTLPTVIPFALATSGGVATIANAGNGVYYPSIRINGPSTGAHVRNSTLGVQFNIDTTITAAQYVVVDLANQTVLLNGSTNYLQYFTGDWWWLEPGNNLIQFNSEDNNPASSCVISWRSAYLGI